MATLLTIFLSCLALLSIEAAPYYSDIETLEFKPKSYVPMLDGRIVGGSEVLITKVPWQLSLQRNSIHICGGSIISKEFAVTAAHCIYGVEVQNLQLRAGSSKYNSGGILYPITTGYVHQSYDALTADYDIAILKVKPFFALGSTLIQNVKLPEIGYVPKVGSELLVSGWGVLSSNSGALSSMLRAVTVPMISRLSCKESYSSKEITNRMLCAGYSEGGKDACQGDSGGPLVQGNTLVGIVSWGYGCAVPNKPGVYSDIGALRTWITYMTGV